MDNFVLAQPEQTDHQCQSDQLIVSGGSPIPAICGVNSGSHSKYPIYSCSCGKPHKPVNFLHVVLVK